MSVTSPRRTALAAFVIVAASLSTAAGAAPAEDGASHRLTLDNGTQAYTLDVEVVDTAQGRARGLMERDSLAADAGMLFLYDREQAGANAFWMYRTRIPLDIAFLGGDGRIRALKTMSPCRAQNAQACPVYPAGEPFRAALEVNAGYFEAHDLAVGDRIDLSAWLGER
ncbi:DUF192 domain-containing protein [Salinicola halophilus]|uniref:DUF192 domain-containing protein n=1 Tax=Salinicola halophilus TaxID=184065 RepID=UPI000DA231C7|nr:DUF192 domain-containing protein [Salinicola halophilus]